MQKCLNFFMYYNHLDILLKHKLLCATSTVADSVNLQWGVPGKFQIDEQRASVIWKLEKHSVFCLKINAYKRI